MNDKISILRIVEDTTVDGPGFRTSIYSAGCQHRCRNCHNPQSWDISNGTMMSVRDVADRILSSDSDVTFSGGDPLMQAAGFVRLARLIKTESKKNIWCYTGFTFEHICNDKKLKAVLQYIDVLVDGQFIEELSSNKLIFKGSSNQRLIDVRRSLQEDKVVIFEYNPFPEF